MATLVLMYPFTLHSLTNTCHLRKKMGKEDDGMKRRVGEKGRV